MALQLEFRPATNDDVTTVVELVESAYRGEASRAGWTTEADLLSGPRTSVLEVVNSIADHRTVLVLAEGEGPHGRNVMGCCRVRRENHEEAMFGMYAVRPGLQGVGVGRRLLAEVERVAATEWGSSVIGLQVLTVRHELIAWYERLGYRRTGECVPFPSDDPGAGVRREGLVFEVLRKPIVGSSAGDQA